MDKITIVCHPSTPVPTSELEDWLEERLEGLREVAPQGIIRHSRLAQDLPDTEVEVGWLIELEIPETSVQLKGDRLADALGDHVTDMRFLGLQPNVLTPQGPESAGAHPAGLGWGERPIDAASA
jgi:hypothetical protein